MSNLDALFQPLHIKRLVIRNRFFSSSHAPGYAEHGNITERYLRYEEEKARGGVGLVQFGGATAVSVENSFHYGQVNGAVDGVIPQYRRMAAGIHRHGAACTVQLTHGGRRERWDVMAWLPAFSPSPTRELIHRSFAAEMEPHDFRRIRADYVAAVQRARDGDLDGAEISCQAGTLIEQFWSPAMNRRVDRYGGALANRLRFGLEVLEAIREGVGDDFVVGIRMPGDEMLAGGLSGEDCVEIARVHAASGLVDFISVVGGQAGDYLASARIWPTMWVPGAAYLPLAGAIKAVSTVPVFHATRITDAATAAHAVSEGMLDMVGMTRAFIADPHHVAKLRSGREDQIRPCVGVGYCVDRVVSGHDALCAHNVATGRELELPQVIAPGDGARRQVTVVGGGPGGMEAARVCAARGHRVVLLEATHRLGGQIELAARATWRLGLRGISAWLAGEIRRLGVKVRLGLLADRDTVLAQRPQVVVIATGGLPNVGWFAGRELATTVWDVLSGETRCSGRVLLVDESGDHAALSCAEFLAAAGCKVDMVTPDRALGAELGDTNLGAHMHELYRLGVSVRPDTRVVDLRRAGNGLVAVLANSYAGREEEQLYEHVVGSHGTLPNDELYHELKPHSVNQGEVDLAALSAARVVHPEPERGLLLYRVGDAWSGRNMHAAMLDAMRLCHNL